MKKTMSLLGLLLMVTALNAQKLHSTAEIMRVMIDSKLKYEVELMKKPIPGKDYSDKLNYHNFYRVSTDSMIKTLAYTFSEQSKPLFNKAESLFQSNPDSAIYYYKLALKADPQLFLVMTYIGQVYEQKKDLENAMKWYKKAISNNYIDYMAHWFLADAYESTGKLDEAVDEIVIAQILNRNNFRIKSAMNRIFGLANKSTEDWSFNPQVKIEKKSENSISVAMDEKWIGYGIAKAIWEFEPGYKASMGIKINEHSTLEDKECLASLLVSLENAKVNIDKDPQLRVLKEAVLSKYIDEYIYYEMILPENPSVAYQLPEETILRIKDYILKVRNK